MWPKNLHLACCFICLQKHVEILPDTVPWPSGMATSSGTSSPTASESHEAHDIFKCTYCGAHLFEESHTGLWCCGQGAYNVQDLPSLDADFYEHPGFLERARAYNDMNALCAMGISGGYRHPSGLSYLKIEGRMYHKIYNLDARGQSFRYNNLDRYINHCRLYIDDGEERLALAEGRGLKVSVR